MSTFEQITEHIWIMHADHETDRPILAAISGTKRTLLMDAGNSPSHAALFRKELQRQGVRLPEMLVLTHWHWDHTFGMSEWNLPTIAQKGTAHQLRNLIGLDWSDATMDKLSMDGIINSSTISNMKKEYGDERNIRIVEPDILFQESITIELGGVSCEVKHVGGDHSSDSSYVYIKEDKTLFLGDALGPSVYGGPRCYTASRFLRLLDLAYQYDAKIFVESHGYPMEREAFSKELGDWEQLARLVEIHGSDREKVVSELIAHLQVVQLPDEFTKALDWFMVGVAKGSSDQVE